jgi:hypothetical protein
MNARHVHFYVNVKQWRKVKKKKKIGGYSVKYVYFIRLCANMTCPEIIRLLFFKSFSPCKYNWVVCMCMSPGAHVRLIKWVGVYVWQSLEWHEWSAPNHCLMVNRYWRANCFFRLLTFLSCKKWWLNLIPLLYVVCLPSLMTVLSYFNVPFGYGQLFIDLTFYYQNVC